MDPFFLTFKDPRLERRYLRHITEAKTLSVDRYYWCYAFIVRGFAYWKYASRFGPEHFAVARVYLAWLVVEAILRRTACRANLPYWRESLVVISRLIHTVEVGTIAEKSLSDLLDFESEHVSMKSIMISLMDDGLFSMLFLGFFQPLRFWLHLPVHLVSSIFLLTTMNLQVCSLTEGAGVPGMRDVLTRLDGAAQGIVGAVFGTRIAEEPSWKIESPCLQMAMFNQGYLGFAILSYFVWVSEHSSRVAFLRARWEAGELAELVEEPLQGPVVLLHAILFLVAFGIFWRVFLGVAPEIMRVGICSAWYVRPTDRMCSGASQV